MTARSIMKPVVLIWFVVISATSAECLAYRFVNLGEQYPQFCAKQLNGKQFCSSHYNDSILIISFFTLRHSPSLKALSDLQEIHEKYAKEGIHVVGVLSGNFDKKSLEEILRIRKITFPILLDAKRKIYGDFGVFVYPSTGIFSKDRKLKYYIASHRINYKNYIEAYIRFLLGDITKNEFEKTIHPRFNEKDSKYEKAKNYYNFANVYFKQGKLEKAKKILDLAIRLYDKYALLYSLYGYIHIQEGECKLGLEKFEFAISLDSTLQEAQHGRQICLDKLKK